MTVRSDAVIMSGAALVLAVVITVPKWAPLVLAITGFCVVFLLVVWVGFTLIRGYESRPFDPERAPDETPRRSGFRW